MELAALRPELVRRAVLLDPAIFIPPLLARDLAADARREESYGSIEEAIEVRITRSGLAHTPRELLEEEVREHAFEDDGGRLRYRYSGDSVGEAYMQMAIPPPPFDTLRFPTLLVVGSLSKVVSAGEVELYRHELGDLLRLEVVPGGHSVLWDAFDETAAAIDSFLET
jgi:pimeloyl-ACP methyl ester carboxylesterase